MITPTRTYSPVEIPIRYVRYAETHGFTGHEHYADLKIINMKAPGEREQKQACLIFVEREVLRDEVSTYGRLYDPVIARFFSPDNFVQVPYFTQSYNRYSYCLNNPLQYVDPSGENLTFPWYRDILGIVHWIGSADDIPATGVFLGDQGVFTSNGEMRYYHADGAISGIQLPRVTISRQESSIMFTPFFSSARFGTIDNITELQGNNPSNFHYVAPINPGYINGLNGFAMANGVKTNLIEAAVRNSYKSANSWWKFQHLRPKQKVFRYNQILGETGVKYLKGYKGLGIGVAVLSAGMEAINYHSYYQQNGFDWKVTTKFGLDMIMTGVGFLGPVGLTVSSIYFILDVTTDSFGGFGNMY